MPPERFRLAAAVYGALLRDDQVLLMRRAGYHDGELGLPAGHLDGGEDAVSGILRELKEELTITVDPAACRLALLLHRPRQSVATDEYLDLVFTITEWADTPRIGEPTKCTELVWAPLGRLPVDVVDYVAAAIGAIGRGEPLLLYGWGAPAT